VTELLERAARLHAAGLAASDNGRPAVAVRQLRAGLRLLAGRPGPDEPALADVRGRLLVSLAWAESERGRVEVGFRLLAEAAILLKRAGRDELALRQFDEAVARLSQQAAQLDLVKALNNRGLLHLDAGHVRLARADLRRCVQVATRHGLALPAALSKVNLGCLDLLAGDLPSALRAFTLARSEYQALAPGRLANLAVERARALVAAGLFGEADDELAGAIEQAARQHLSYTYADALQVRAEAALLAGRPGEAAGWARESQSRFLARGNARRAAVASLLQLRAEQAEAAGAYADRPGAYAGLISRRAQLLAARLARLGLPEDARVAGLVGSRALVAAGRLRSADQLAARYRPPGRVDRLDTRLLWRLTRAELAAAAGRRAEAARHLAAGMTALHRHRAQVGCLDLQTGAAVHGRDLARAGLAAALAGGSPAAVYRWSERARAQALLLPPVRPPPDPEATATLEELRQVRYALRAAELAGRPAGALRARVQVLQRSLRERLWSTPGHRRPAGPALAPFPAVKRELAGAALVTYLRDGPWLRALVVVDGSASLVAVGRYAAAEEAVLRLRADLDAQAGRALPRRLATAVAAATRQDASSLTAAVLRPLLSRIGDRELVVVPTGVLMTVPWSVLPGCTGRPVTVAPSASSWHAARSRLRAGPAGSARPPGPAGSAGSAGSGAAPGRRVLLVAGPGNRRGAAEVTAIAALHPDPTVLTGAAATPAATRSALGRAGLAHLVAHGHHQPENALFSTLELAGGPLLGYDLQRVAGVPRMVVLSSCDLGLTDIRPGDETIGMVTALLHAGSATVLASVSRVADDTATAVMTRFHRAIVAGRTPAEALARAGPPEPPTGFVCFGAS
jgi:hypothetical protein